MSQQEKDRKIVSRLEMVFETALLQGGSSVFRHIVESVLDVDSPWNRRKMMKRVATLNAKLK